MTMTRQDLIDFCLTLPSAYEDYPFDEVVDENATTVMRHKVNKKSFALIIRHNGRLYLNLKCDPFEAGFLRQAFKGVIPGYHMNKEHWNSVILGLDVPDEEIKRQIENSYNMIRPKASSSRRARVTREWGEFASKEDAHFNLLTKYISKMGTPLFSEKLIDAFVDEFYLFAKNHPEYQLERYNEILAKNGIEWSYEAMDTIDVKKLNTQCILALIMVAVRAERFCEGVLLGFFREGHILKWLECLKEIKMQNPI